MPQVRMPTGEVVDMPDQLDPAMGARLRAYQTEHATPPTAAPQPSGMFTDRNNQPELLPMLAEGGKELLQSALHTAGTLMDVGTGTAPGPGSHAERWASQIHPDPTVGGLVNPNPAITPDQISHAYDSAFGTGPLAQTVKERAPQAAEAISAVVPAAEGATSLAGRVSPAVEAALRAPVGQAGEAFSGARASEAASARNMAAANPKVDPALLDRTGFRTGSGQGVAKAVAGEDTGPALQAHNQALGNTILSGEANVPAGTQLSYDATNAARQGPDSVYSRAAAGIPEGPLNARAQSGINSAGQPEGGRMTKGTPVAQQQIQDLRAQLLDPTKSWNGQQIVNEVRGLRQDGFKNVAVEDDVSKNELGRAQLDMARALEGHIEDNLPAHGDVSLEQFKDARKTLAKNHAIEGALKGGDVDLKAIGRMQRASPDLLDGGMKDVADFVNSREGSAVVGIPNALKEPSLTGSALDALDLHRPVRGAARFFGGATARKALTGDTGAAVDAAVSRYGAKPDRFAPLEPKPPTPGDWTIGEGANPNTPQPQGRPGDVPLADLLSQGVEQSPPVGLSAGPMGAPAPRGIQFRGSPEAVGARVKRGGPVAEAPSHVLGPDGEPVPTGVEPDKVSLADRLAPPGQGQQEPGVMYQGRAGGPMTPTQTRQPQLHQGAGVPDDTATRTTPQPKVTHEADEDTGAHVFRTANGETHAQENGPYLMSKRTDTAEAAQGQGENTARLEAQIQQAEHRGLIAGSDVSVTEAAAKGWQALERKGYDVKRNDFTTNTHTKGGKTYKTFVSTDPRKPVFEATTPLAKAVGQ